jgi:hypothetical protein
MSCRAFVRVNKTQFHIERQNSAMVEVLICNEVI